jgi:hypothetical protein
MIVAGISRTTMGCCVNQSVRSIISAKEVAALAPKEVAALAPKEVVDTPMLAQRVIVLSESGRGYLLLLYVRTLSKQSLMCAQAKALIKVSA